MKITFIGPKPKWTVSKDRLEGYKRALQVNNVPYQESLVYHGEAFNQETGKKGMMIMASL